MSVDVLLAAGVLVKVGRMWLAEESRAGVAVTSSCQSRDASNAGAAEQLCGVPLLSVRNAGDWRLLSRRRAERSCRCGGVNRDVSFKQDGQSD